MKNKYIIRSRISEKKFREFLRYFCLDIEAVKIAEICKISENSVGKYCKALRILMACECEKISKLSGEIEIDESFFGAGRVRGKLGQRSWQKDDSFWHAKTRWKRLYASRQKLLGKQSSLKRSSSKGANA